MNAMLLTFWKDESGQDAAAYALFIAVVVIVLILAYGPARRWLASQFGAAAGVLDYRG